MSLPREIRAPAAVFAATALFVVWLWGSLRAPSFVHDEAAYRLQARIFASFRWSAPAPPLPEFFEQYHVLVTPRLAPKYPPGHALLLVPGAWLDLPGLVPVLLQGLAAALFFVLARRLSDGWVAALAWLVWLSAPALNLWRATYLSQSTSTAVWMLGAWLLLRWWETGRRLDLVGVAMTVAWMGLTRPLTGVAFALPIGIVVLVRTWRRRRWADLGVAVVAALPILALVPIWAKASTGDWRTIPYSHYSRVYFPYQKLGFGAEPTPPLRELPADMRVFDEQFRAMHGAYTVAALPRNLAERVRAAGNELFGGSRWRPFLLVFFVVGLVALGSRGWFAVSWVPALFLVYLAFAHETSWAVYYYEIQAIPAYVAALGLVRVLRAGLERARAASATARPLALPASLLAVLVAVLGLADSDAPRREIRRRTAYAGAFARALDGIPEPKAIVFVRYGPAHSPHQGLIENPPDFSEARIWTAWDRGPDNARLAALAPDRALYLFDEGSWTLYRVSR